MFNQSEAQLQKILISSCSYLALQHHHYFICHIALIYIIKMPFNICCRQIYWKKNQTYWKLCKIEIYRISPLSKRPIQAPCCDIFTCSKLCQLIERIRHLDHIQGSTHAAWDCIIRQWCCCWIRCIFESFHKCLLRRTQCRLQSILSVQRSYLESCMFVLNSCTCKYERDSDGYIMQIPEETSTFPKKCRVQIVGQKFNILAEMNCIMIWQ